MWLFLLSFLKKYWKPLAIAGVVSAVLMFTYVKGRQSCEQKQVVTTVREIEKRYDNAQRETDKITRVDQKMEASKKSAPSGSSREADKRDSCILSNDPYTTECVQ